MDLITLSHCASIAVGMNSSEELKRQCHEFFKYIKDQKWHHSVRKEARILGKLFNAISKRCAKEMRKV